jgi:mevalonate kinase
MLGPFDHGHDTTPTGGQSSGGGGGGCGCSVAKRRVQTNVALLFVLAGGALAMRSLRRRRS